MTFSISFRLKSVNFEFFDPFLGCWNQFGRDNWDSDDEFRSKKSIKRQFDYDIKQNLAQDRLQHQSLQRLQEKRSQQQAIILCQIT